MKLLYKVTLPIVTVFIISILLFAAVFYGIESSEIRESIRGNINKQIERATEKIDENEEMVLQLKEELSVDYLMKARMIALLIQYQPEIIEDTMFLQEMCNKLDIEEIHIIDEEGILRWGTVAGFYDFDFKESEQTLPFMKILEDATYELVQEPEARGADGVLFQYVGVSRLDERGIIQIGVSPTRLAQKLQSTALENAVDQITFNEVGYLVVVDRKDEKILSTPNKADIGKQAVELFGRALTEDEVAFSYKNAQGEKYYAYYNTVGDYKVIGILPMETLIGATLRNFIAFMGGVLLIMVACMLIIHLLIRKEVIREMDKMQDAFKEIIEGDLTYKETTYNSLEFRSMGESMNRMIAHIQDMMHAEDEVVHTLNQVGESLGEVTNTTNVRMEQIALAVEGLSLRNEEQVHQVVDGEAAISVIYSRIEDIRSSIQDSVESVYHTKEITQEGSVAVRNQAIQMEELVRKFEKVDQTVLGLQSFTEEIDKVVDTIRRITDQIRLLAVNASIEATRVGEMGKGFAVVATQVDQLSMSSKEATVNIARMITGIKKYMLQVTADTTDAKEAVILQKTCSSEVLNQFAGILDSMEVSLDKVKSIRGASEEITLHTGNINELMKKMHSDTVENSVVTEEINTTVQEEVGVTQEINGMSEELADMVNKLSEVTREFIIKI